MFLFQRLRPKYCNKNTLCSDEYRDLFQSHGTVKHCISKIISGILSTWSKSVRTFIFFFFVFFFSFLGEFHIYWSFWFSLIPSTVAL